MRSLDCFIVKPLGERYNNDVEVGEKKLITNANIESFRHINKKAVIVEIPKNFKSPIKKGDVVLIHHNIFRRYYGMSGKEKNGSTYFKDDMYFAYPEQIYVYQRNNKWYTNENYYPKELSRIKTIFDWKEYPEDFKEEWYDYIEKEFERRENGFWFNNKGKQK
jgi:hypothetical protein